MYCRENHPPYKRKLLSLDQFDGQVLYLPPGTSWGGPGLGGPGGGSRGAVGGGNTASGGSDAGEAPAGPLADPPAIYGTAAAVDWLGRGAVSKHLKLLLKITQNNMDRLYRAVIIVQVLYILSLQVYGKLDIVLSLTFGNIQYCPGWQPNRPCRERQTEVPVG